MTGSGLPESVAITGATGLIGGALAAALRAAGTRVVPVSRRQLPGGAKWDPETGEIDRARLEGIGAVVHLAGESIAAGRWNARRRQAIRSSRTDGTSLLARTLASLDSPPPVFLSASAVGIYGDRGDTILDEESSPGSGFLADTAVAWENAAAPARERGIRVAHPRFGIVLAREGGVLPRMLLPFRLGLGGKLGTGRQWLSWIAIDDAVRALVLLLSDPTLTGPVNVTAPSPATNAEFAATLARVLRRPAILTVPAPVLRLVLGEMADALLLASQRAVPRRLENAGFEFRHRDLGPALRALLGREAR